jgi:hypothetical protein
MRAFATTSTTSAAAALVAAALATAPSGAAAAPARLTIETCKPGFAGEAFAVNADGTVTQGGQCVGFDATSLLLAACSGGPEQVWSFQPDGTVHNKADSANCWNVIGGGTAPGGTVGMYECGVKAPAAGVAANDIFWPLPGAGTIRANESGLCLSSAAPPSTCDGDECCSLNGVWSGSGGCECYSPWTGANCSSLDLLPAPPVQGYGMAPNVTSWGGNIIMDFGGTYHLYVAEMVNHCPLNTWGSNSRCTHATATAIEGPFTFSDVAVDIWCHNPHVMVQTDGVKATYALFHIGDGTGGNPKNCSASAALGAGGDVAALQRPARPAASGSTLHTATSPYGPWTPVQPSPPSCNNPAPYLHPNGTWYLLCDGSTIYTAPGLTGPWTRLTSVAPSGGHGVAGTYEDPFLWMDTRGNWHVSE